MSDLIRIPVGEGSPEGVNSAYLITEKDTIVDPGPPTEKAWNVLRSKLDERSITFDDIDHVFVTHWHSDHAGLACRLAEETGATIHMHPSDAPLVGDYAAARERRLDRDVATLRRWGVPETRRDALLDADSPSTMPETYPVATHRDGEMVAGLEVLHTPGHTAGHVSLAVDETLLLGDLLLPTYTPNVGGSDTRIDDPLAAYLSSIDRVNARFEEGEPGHGTTMDVTRAVDGVRVHHRERAHAAFHALSTVNDPTPWAVARDLFGEMCGIHAKFGAGEAAAHLDRLVALDIVERTGDDPVRYRPRVDDYPSNLRLMP